MRAAAAQRADIGERHQDNRPWLRLRLHGRPRAAMQANTSCAIVRHHHAKARQTKQSEKRRLAVRYKRLFAVTHSISMIEQLSLENRYD